MADLMELERRLWVDTLTNLGDLCNSLIVGVVGTEQERRRTYERTVAPTWDEVRRIRTTRPLSSGSRSYDPFWDDTSVAQYEMVRHLMSVLDRLYLPKDSKDLR